MSRFQKVVLATTMCVGGLVGASGQARAWGERVAYFDSVGPSTFFYPCPERPGEDANTITSATVYIGSYNSMAYVKACASSMTSSPNDFTDCSAAVPFSSTTSKAIIENDDVETWQNGGALGKYLLFQPASNNMLGGIYFTGD